ncbi:MAG: lysine 5,6-aminomutase subunit alpha [bacterium]
MSKLSLDRDQIDQCRDQATQIIRPILHNVNRHTTFSIERSTLRMLGVEGALEEGSKEPAPQGRYPLVNGLLDKIGQDRLGKGAAYWFGLAAAHHARLTPTTLARKIVAGEIDLQKLEPAPLEKIDEACQAFLAKTIAKLRTMGEKRKKRPAWPLSAVPLRYVIVATGNIQEDIWQAQAAAEMGADIIAVIRSTAQSLLDYVPEGETTEGFGGTFATQENFRLMREALDQSEKKLKRRIGLTNYSSGLCMPEIAVLGALEGIDYLLNDAMYGILFRDINMKRNFIDQYFARRICALSGITIQTGEDNYLTTAESHKYWYQVLASHFLNESFAKAAGLPDNQIALGHAHEIDPWIEDSILYEWAQAELVREVFPRSPIKFMPPTKHKTGDIFFSYLYDGLFNLAGIMTGQNIQLLGMHTEAIHNPFVQDRFLSLKNANYVFRGAKSIKDEILFQNNGKIARRARQVLEDALNLLRKIRGRGLMAAIEEGAFANVKRQVDGGKGLDGVFEKDRDYYTPLKEYLTPKQEHRGEESRRSERGRGRDRLSGQEGTRDRGRNQERAMERERGRESGREQGRDRGRERGRGRGGRGRDRGPRREAPAAPPSPAAAAIAENAPVAAAPERAITSETVVSEAVILLPAPVEERGPSEGLEGVAPAGDSAGEVATTRSGPGERGTEGGERRGRSGRGRRRGRRGGRGRGRRGQGGPRGSGPGGEGEAAPQGGGYESGGGSYSGGESGSGGEPNGE